MKVGLPSTIRTTFAGTAQAYQETLNAAISVGALLPLMLFHIDLSIIAMIGIRLARRHL